MQRRGLAGVGKAFAPAVAVAVILVFAAVPSAASAQIVLPEEVDFHNATYVGDEPEPARLAFYRAEEHRAAGRFVEAGREVLKLLRGETSGRVRHGERLVVPVETSALLFLLALPAEARVELAQEEIALEPPLPRDTAPATFRAYASRHPLSANAAVAWLRAGTLALLAGDSGAATADLERAVHWPFAGVPRPGMDVVVDPDSARALAAARLLEAHQRLGEPPPTGPLAIWPESATVQLANAGGSGTTTIGDLLGRARESFASAPAFPVGRPQPRFVVRHSSPSDQIPNPEYALHRSRFVLPSDTRRDEDRLELKDLPFLSPLVLEDKLVTLERLAPTEEAPVAIHVRGLEDGRELFPPIRSDFDLHLDPREAMVVPARSSLAVHRSKLGSKLLVTLELRRHGLPFRDVFRGSSVSGTVLASLDLEREGYVEFRVTSTDLAADPELAGFVFAGPPVVASGRVLVAASRFAGKETECALLAFDARSGAPAGRCLLARASAIPRFADRFVEDEPRRVNPSPAVLRGGTAYVCTNLGAIAAVRAADLELEWLFRYHRAPAPESDRYERNALYDKEPWIGRAPVVLADRVLATPADSRYLYSLARWPNARGDLLLNDPIEQLGRVCWLGADEKTCWFLVRVGRAGAPQFLVEATDHDGSRLWGGDPRSLLIGRVTGVPAIAGRFLFVPTDRCIFRVDLEREGYIDLTLAPPKDAPFVEFGTFGDLAVGGRTLVSTSDLMTIVIGGTE